MLGLCMLLSFKSNRHCNIVWAFFAALTENGKNEPKMFLFFDIVLILSDFLALYSAGTHWQPKPLIFSFLLCVSYRWNFCRFATHVHTMHFVRWCFVCIIWMKSRLGTNGQCVKWTIMGFTGVMSTYLFFPVLSSVHLHCVTCNMMIFEHDLWCSVNSCGTAFVSLSIRAAGIIVTVRIYFGSIRAC